MLATNLFTGERVRLGAAEPDTLAEAISRWVRDTEYWRMLSGDPAKPFSKKEIQTWVEKRQAENGQKHYWFAIYTLAENRLIGDVTLDGIQWAHREGWIGIGIGARDCWGKGYGTDAMRLILRYAFQELNLYKVSLDVLENNARGLRSYEKAGFKVEGRKRQLIFRNNQRWDVINMSILCSEWLQMHGQAAALQPLQGEIPA